MIRFHAAVAGAFALSSVAVLAQSIPATTTSGWTVDRTPTDSFTSTTVGGQTALQLGVSSAEAQPTTTFDATQGYKYQVNPSQVQGAWAVSGDLYVTSAMLAGTAGPLGAELWGSTGYGPGTQNGYYIMQFLSGASGNNNGAITAVPSATSEMAIWNEVTASWDYVSDTGIKADAYNSFDISANPDGTVNYYLNGVDIFTETGLNVNDVDLGQLEFVRLDDYNFYDQGAMPATGSYTTAWSDLAATETAVPDAWSTFAGMTICFGSLLILKRVRFARVSA
ncbi:MAG TPA: hypothetical protein VH595_11255 [Verrucomicrobiae bacterium]|nr:hypothetical protein [Verrucomicrobiae bacterium]